jgi:hypothetical protein
MKNAKCVGCSKEFSYNPSQKNGIYCSNKCQMKYQQNLYVDGWLRGVNSGGTGFELSKHIRNYLIEQSDNKCSQCGWNEINPHTGNIPLQIDHIDGDPHNHSAGNLRVLCPNCHSLTPTYGRRGKGRKGRRALLMSKGD